MNDTQMHKPSYLNILVSSLIKGIGMIQRLIEFHKKEIVFQNYPQIYSLVLINWKELNYLVYLSLSFSLSASQMWLPCLTLVWVPGSKLKQYIKDPTVLTLCIEAPQLLPSLSVSAPMTWLLIGTKGGNSQMYQTDSRDQFLWRTLPTNPYMKYVQWKSANREIRRENSHLRSGRIIRWPNQAKQLSYLIISMPRI